MSPAKSILIALILAISPATLYAQETIFPRVDTVDLNGREVSFPDQLPADPTLVLVAFKQKQQDNLNEWINGMNLAAADAPAWVELPVVPNYGALWRGFVNGGMRSGITKTDDRARVFTIFVDPERFRSFFDMPTENDVYLMVVEQDGTVRETVRGDYSQQKADLIRAALN